VNKALVDTDVLSYFLRGRSDVASKFREYIAEHAKVTFSVLTYYEILSGLKHRDARRQLDAFLALSSTSEILPLSREASEAAAERYAELRASGGTLDDIDLLIAGTAIANRLVLVTHNAKHFERIRGLTVEDWHET
jgi:tRNA(fMet)-specific endonuclease VapC